LRYVDTVLHLHEIIYISFLDIHWWNSTL